MTTFVVKSFGERTHVSLCWVALVRPGVSVKRGGEERQKSSLPPDSYSRKGKAVESYEGQLYQLWENGNDVGRVVKKASNGMDHR